MNLLGRKKKLSERGYRAQSAFTDDERTKREMRQRKEAEIKMILNRLNDRMKTFRPMMEKMFAQLESVADVTVLHPTSVTYGDGNPYFPTYEWKIYPNRNLSDASTDPRNVTLQLRASLGRDLTVILVYYLLSYVDSSGNDHPIHQQPTNIQNETLIKALLWEGMQRAGFW